MQKELTKTGVTVNFAAVNSIDALANQSSLTALADFPMFQDVDAVKAWKQVSGDKDDLFIYGTDGKLAHYLPIGGAVNTDLSNPDAYNAVKKLITDTK